MNERFCAHVGTVSRGCAALLGTLIAIAGIVFPVSADPETAYIVHAVCTTRSTGSLAILPFWNVVDQETEVKVSLRLLVAAPSREPAGPSENSRTSSPALLSTALQSITGPLEKGA